MKANELREKNAGELQEELTAKYKELFNLRMQRSVGQLGQSHLFKQARRDIARIKTILAEKASAAGE